MSRIRQNNSDLSLSLRLVKKNRFKIYSEDSLSNKVLEQRYYWYLIKTKILFRGLIIAISVYHAAELSFS